MASSAARSDRVYHQDYIARIRYSNTLPPPPNPPKLLDIPNTGLANGQYTSAAFASRFAREQPLNIEADAELGMPINLIGLPGVFDGDESFIRSLDNPPQPHPHDKPLLRPLSMLGKPASSKDTISFLRKTEYMSSEQSKSRFDSTTSRDLVQHGTDARKRKRPETEHDDDPVRILRTIVKGFDVAYPEDAYTGPDSGSNIRGAEVTPSDIAAWKTPKHPTDSTLQVLDSYPILPDVESFTDSGSYLVTKFITNPVTASDTYDTRLDVGLLRPLELSPEAAAELEAERAAVEADPTLPKPGPPKYDYEFFVPEDSVATPSIKTKLSMNYAENQDPALYDGENKETGKRFFRYQRLRAYETYQQTGDHENPYGDVVALALHDAETQSRLQKAAYYYPVVQRTFIRPRRANAARIGAASENPTQEDGKIDFIEMVVRDADDIERSQREGHRERVESAPVAVVAAAA